MSATIEQNTPATHEQKASDVPVATTTPETSWEEVPVAQVRGYAQARERGRIQVQIASRSWMRLTLSLSLPHLPPHTRSQVHQELQQPSSKASMLYWVVKGQPTNYDMLIFREL